MKDGALEKEEYLQHGGYLSSGTWKHTRGKDVVTEQEKLEGVHVLFEA